MASFDAFNFEADPRWQSYLNSVEILADPTSALQQLQRLKQKWYRKYVVRTSFIYYYFKAFEIIMTS